MTQSSKKTKRRKLPKTILEKSDHEVMECLFGKRIMKKVDDLVDDQKTRR